MTQRRTLFIPTSPIDAYQQWKSYWHLVPDAGESGTKLLADVPNAGVRWTGRLGLARVYGQADFIPAQGGCVVYLAVTGAGAVSRLLLSSPLERYFWRAADSFGAITEGLRHEGAA